MALKRSLIEGLVAFAVICLTFRIVPAALWHALLIKFHIRQAVEPETLLEAAWQISRWALIVAGWIWVGYKLTTKEWEQVRWTLLMAFMGILSLVDAAARQRRAIIDAEVRVRFEEDHSSTIILLLFLAAIAGSGSNVVG